MSELDPIQIRLIQKMTRASVMLEGLRRKHSDTCPVDDPHIPMACRCGADEHNKNIANILSILDPSKD